MTPDRRFQGTQDVPPNSHARNHVYSVRAKASPRNQERTEERFANPKPFNLNPKPETQAPRPIVLFNSAHLIFQYYPTTSTSPLLCKPANERSAVAVNLAGRMRRRTTPSPRPRPRQHSPSGRALLLPQRLPPPPWAAPRALSPPPPIVQPRASPPPASEGAASPAGPRARSARGWRCRSLRRVCAQPGRGRSLAAPTRSATTGWRGTSGGRGEAPPRAGGCSVEDVRHLHDVSNGPKLGCLIIGLSNESIFGSQNSRCTSLTMTCVGG